MTIEFFHSGGSGNDNPSKDLGGKISKHQMHEGLNALFDDVNPKQSRLGLIDYRCFYVKNTGKDIVRNVKLFIDWERKNGSFIDLGTKIADDVQVITISGSSQPNEGDTMVVSVPEFGSATVKYFPVLTEWQGEFQTQLRGVDGLDDVRVTTTSKENTTTFKIFFVGQTGSRKMKIIKATGMPHQTIKVTHYIEGSPVNTDACTIGTIYQAPSCAEFDLPLRGSPFELGDLLPNDHVPIWVRRTTWRGHHTYLRDKVRVSVIGLTS